MEIEIKEADLIKIETGDLLVFKLGRQLKVEEARHMQDIFGQLKKKLKEISGKDIAIIMLEGGSDLDHYRLIERKED